MTIRRHKGLTATAAALLLVGGCTESTRRDHTHSAPLQRGGSITFGVIGEPPTLAPYAPGASELTWALARPVYPSLFRFDADGTPEPYLAQSAVRRDGFVEIELADMTWSNGRAITARDVAASARAARPPSGFARFGAVDVVGPQALALRDPPRYWREALATVAFVMPDGKPSLDSRVFGGPWVIDSYKPGLEVVYRPNREWTGEKPILEQVNVQFVENMDILLGLLANDELDAAAPLSTIHLAQRLDALGLDHDAKLGWESLFAEFNLSSTDEPTRVAIADAIDRSMLVRSLMGHEGRLSNTLSPTPGPGGAQGRWRRAPSGGTALTLPVGMAAPIGDEVFGLLERALFREFKRAGIELEFLNVPARTFYGSWKDGGPADVLLRRTMGAPGLGAPASAFRDFAALPLAHVQTFVTWSPRVAGPAANPTLEGPLWNMHEWGLVAEAS